MSVIFSSAIVKFSSERTQFAIMRPDFINAQAKNMQLALDDNAQLQANVVVKSEFPGEASRGPSSGVYDGQEPRFQMPVNSYPTMGHAFILEVVETLSQIVNDNASVAVAHDVDVRLVCHLVCLYARLLNCLPPAQNVPTSFRHAVGGLLA